MLVNMFYINTYLYISDFIERQHGEDNHHRCTRNDVSVLCP